jgi:hypothetical protein
MKGVKSSNLEQLFFANSDLHDVFRLKLHCDERFTHAFSVCDCVFKEIMLVDSNQGNNLENTSACSKRICKTLVATQLYVIFNPRSNLIKPSLSKTIEPRSFTRTWHDDLTVTIGIFTSLTWV